MKQHLYTVLLTCLAFAISACDDAVTDKPLPEGTAPNDAEQVSPEADALTGKGAPDPDQTLPEPEESPDPDPVPTAEVDRTSVPGLSFVIPKGWSIKPSTSSMRVVTLVPPADKFPGAELAVFRWGNRVGGFGANVERWAQQVGTAAPSLKRTDYEQLDISGTASAYITLANKDANKAVLAFWIPLGDNPDADGVTWTPKLTCTAEQALKLEAPLKAWAGSIEFE